LKLLTFEKLTTNDYEQGTYVMFDEKSNF